MHECAALAAHLNRAALSQGHSQLLAEMLEAIFGEHLAIACAHASPVLHAATYLMTRCGPGTPLL